MVQQPTEKHRVWGSVVIPDGERWKVCHADASIETLTGPTVAHVHGATMRQLARITASSAEYLNVRHVSGLSEVIPGPASMFMDPAIHTDIQVKRATNLGGHEVLVVYRADSVEASSEERTITRFLIRGPCLHMPKNCTEWVHEFSWHGSVTGDANVARKRAHALNFTKLRTCPDQTYYDVELVRTKDDALVTVKLMMFYRLKDVAVMLEETHDPIADFINAVTSDVIEFVAARTFEEFKLSSEQLNGLVAYQQLTSRAASIGFEVTKVVFRGYDAPGQLQKMHDAAIEQRTQLGLQRETEDQEVRLQDARLEKEEERTRRAWRMEADGKAHELQLSEAAHKAEMEKVLKEREAKIAHLQRLREVGVPADQLATYLLAVEQGPPEKLIKVVGGEGAGSGTTGSSFVQVQAS